MVKVDWPAAFFVLLERFGFLAGACVPHGNGAFIVRAGQRAFVVSIPRDAADFGRGHHLYAGIVQIDRVSDDRPVVKNLYPLRHPCDGKQLVVFVKLYARHYGRIVVESRRVVESCQRFQRAVPREFDQVFSEEI